MSQKQLTIVLAGVFIASLVLAIYPVRYASAKCGGQYPPCPDKTKRPTATTYVNPNATPVETAVSQATQDPNALPTAVCPTSVAPVAANPNPGGSPNSPGGSANTPGSGPINGSFFDLRALGGGLFLGLLLGGFSGFRLGLLKVREAALGGGTLKPGSFFDNSSDAAAGGSNWLKGESSSLKQMKMDNPGGAGGETSSGFDAFHKTGGETSSGFDAFHKTGGETSSGFDAFHKTGGETSSGFDAFKKASGPGKDGSFFDKPGGGSTPGGSTPGG